MGTVIAWVIKPVVCDFTVRSYLKGIEWLNADRAELCEDYRCGECVCAVRSESNCSR